VNGIVLAEVIFAADAVGPHIASALAQIVDRYGAPTIPNIDAAAEALNASTGSES
jgi:2-keto-3-deoxy-6-phosphogluconate aldolase